MMKHLLRALIVCIALLAPKFGMSQCANDNSLTAGNLTPPAVSQSASAVYGAGQYMLCQVISGANYTVSTCGGSGWDTQLTVYDDLTSAFVVYNDDFCGLQSTVSFTASTCGYMRILLDQYFCTTSSNTTTVTVTQNSTGSGAPQLTAAPDQQECYGQAGNVGIANNGTGGTPPYNYSWTPTTNLSTPTASSSAVTTVTTTTVYTLTITDAGGCMDMDTVTVAVLPAPPVALGSDTTICGTNFTIDAGNPGATYLWSTGQGTQTISVTQSGTYSVSVLFPSGCINSDNIVVTLNAPPAFTLGSDTSSCGNNVVVDAGTGFLSYVWSSGGTSQTETVTNSDTISVTVTDANGCVLTDTIGVVLNPAPLVNLGADTAVCGGPLTIDAGNPGALFFWSNSTSSQTTSVSATGIYYVDVLTQAGCASSDTIDVTVNYQPVQMLGPDTSICFATVLLDAGNPGSTYAWSNSMNTQSITVGTGTYSVLITDPAGCSVMDTITVTTNVPPVVTASQDTAICPGGTAMLSASGATSYLWSNNAITNPTSVTPATTTSYYVTGTDANGCQASDVVIVTLVAPANAQFTATVGGATVFVTNQSTGAFSYSWNFGDSSPADNTASPSHTYSTNGTYTVTLTVTGPCGTDTYTQVITITDVGMEDHTLANTLNIYPNPNNGSFVISFELGEAKDVIIQLTDVSGRVISSEVQQNVMQYTHEYNGENLADGTYFITFTTADGTVTRRIVVQQ